MQQKMANMSIGTGKHRRLHLAQGRNGGTPVIRMSGEVRDPVTRLNYEVGEITLDSEVTRRRLVGALRKHMNWAAAENVCGDVFDQFIPLGGSDYLLLRSEGGSRPIASLCAIAVSPKIVSTVVTRLDVTAAERMLDELGSPEMADWLRLRHVFANGAIDLGTALAIDDAA